MMLLKLRTKKIGQKRAIITSNWLKWLISNLLSLQKVIIGETYNYIFDDKASKIFRLEKTFVGSAIVKKLNFT